MSILFWMGMLGCSIRGTVSMVKAEQAYQQALAKRKFDSDNSEEIFMWTMTTAYMKKAREEYSNAHYEQSEELTHKVQSLLLKWESLQQAEKPEKKKQAKSEKTKKTQNVKGKKTDKPASQKPKEK